MGGYLANRIAGHLGNSMFVKCRNAKSTLVATSLLVLACHSPEYRTVAYELDHNGRPFYIGIPNPFVIHTDTSIVCHAYAGGHSLLIGLRASSTGSAIDGQRVYELRTGDSVATLRLDFRERRSDEMVATDEVVIRLERLPPPTLKLGLPEPLWNDVASLKTLEMLRPEVPIEKPLILAGLLNYRMTLLKWNGQVESVSDSLPGQTEAGYSLSPAARQLLQQVAGGDVVIFDQLSAKLPDGTIRKLEEVNIRVQ